MIPTVMIPTVDSYSQLLLIPTVMIPTVMIPTVDSYSQLLLIPTGFFLVFLNIFIQEKYTTRSETEVKVAS